MPGTELIRSRIRFQAPFPRPASNNVLWTLTDRQGSMAHTVDSGGNERLHRVFDSFGDVTSETHYDANDIPVTSGIDYLDEAFAYTGRLFDKDTGLQNNLNRWYSPSLGRWMSEDPIEADVNSYRYVGNSPLNGVDPSGLVDSVSETVKQCLPKPTLAGQIKCLECIESDHRVARLIKRLKNVQKFQKTPTKQLVKDHTSRQPWDKLWKSGRKDAEEVLKRIRNGKPIENPVPDDAMDAYEVIADRAIRTKPGTDVELQRIRMEIIRRLREILK